jgi:hypothetical protein
MFAESAALASPIKFRAVWFCIAAVAFCSTC